MVVGMDLYSEIRQAYLSGESQRSIARRLGISRQSVKKYCEGKTMPGVRKVYSRTATVTTDDVAAFFRACIEADETEGLKKQRPAQSGSTTGWSKKSTSPAPIPPSGASFTS